MTAIVIPSLGGPHLQRCLSALAVLDPAPRSKMVVMSGGAAPPARSHGAAVVRLNPRLGFAAAVNAGIGHLADDVERVALVNDDAAPTPGWLAPLEEALEADPGLAAVQGTVTDADGTAVDGRGIALDAFGLPIQVDRGDPPRPEPGASRTLVAVSATAALFRTDALREATLDGGSIFDPRFGSYHEDLDLGLRLLRLGWRAAWVAGAEVRHVGSASGRTLGWRHPWWILANRWRALAGNLTLSALLSSLPRLLRGEVRAVRTLGRENSRAPLVALASTAAIPCLIAGGLRRPSPGPRLPRLPETPP
jgi:GT2 family glycosyltransferase